MFRDAHGLNQDMVQVALRLIEDPSIVGRE